MSVTNDDRNITIKIILSFLSIIIITCAISLLFKEDKKEGLGEDIGNKILDKMNNFFFHMGRFSDIVNDDFEKIFISIGNNFKNGFQFFGDNIDILGGYFECGIQKLKNFPDCIIFYIIDIIFDIIYSIIYVIFAIIGQTWMLDKSIEFFIKVDCAIYDAMGFHIFQYPQTILDHCYLCSKIVDSDNQYKGFKPNPPPDNPELESPFDELANAFS